MYSVLMTSVFWYVTPPMYFNTKHFGKYREYFLLLPWLPQVSDYKYMERLHLSEMWSLCSLNKYLLWICWVNSWRYASWGSTSTSRLGNDQSTTHCKNSACCEVITQCLRLCKLLWTWKWNLGFHISGLKWLRFPKWLSHGFRTLWPVKVKNFLLISVSLLTFSWSS
jgi:hypothetical protein